MADVSNTSEKKKIKSFNFTATEISVLVEQYEKNKETLKVVKKPEKRLEVWQQIAKEVCNVGVTIRTASQIRNKWDNLQREVKKKMRLLGKGRLLQQEVDPQKKNVENCTTKLSSYVRIRLLSVGSLVDWRQSLILNECKLATCTSNTSQKKKKSISEELQEAQLQFYISQTEKVQIQKQLIKEEIETSKTKRLLMNKLITSIDNKDKDEIGMFQFLVDE
ncbi:uncharacterized protein LOC128244495 [Mya arenaria]|uniref:uncharacterized protein LOC128244495 n=1 Tax=Mya arenaria TaxID=6604 RepID=UPI0022E1FCC2|nr:uncharacterized protein LOC128244495 [Mya arenaria]